MVRSGHMTREEQSQHSKPGFLTPGLHGIARFDGEDLECGWLCDPGQVTQLLWAQFPLLHNGMTVLALGRMRSVNTCRALRSGHRVRAGCPPATDSEGTRWGARAGMEGRLKRSVPELCPSPDSGRLWRVGCR